jgi:hypothetical protein
LINTLRGEEVPDSDIYDTVGYDYESEEQIYDDLCAIKRHSIALVNNLQVYTARLSLKVISELVSDFLGILLVLLFHFAFLCFIAFLFQGLVQESKSKRELCLKELVETEKNYKEALDMIITVRLRKSLFYHLLSNLNFLCSILFAL